MTLIHRSERPQPEWPSATLTAALSVCRALEQLGFSPEAKWPNDLLLSGRMVAGILAETEGRALLIGIGINVLHEETDFSDEIRPRATSIRIEARSLRLGAPPDREAVLRCLLLHLREDLEVLEGDGPRSILDAIWERSLVRDRRIAVRLLSGEILEGRAVGLGPVGELLVRTPGETVAVVSGTVRNLEDR
jgi:BirA family biotin operon repressor/biotin-[acetyl-CoA-carboxylase] ligase